MPRIRSIHYDAFKSRKLAALSPEGERCWWRLQCLCDDAGRCEDEPDVMAAVMFPTRRDITPEMVDLWLQEMALLGLIRRYERNDRRFLAVEKWTVYQRPRRPQSSSIPPPTGPVPTSTDADGQKPTPTKTDTFGRVSLGEEGSGYKEGESEGEADATNPRPQPVEMLLGKAATIAAKCAELNGYDTTAVGVGNQGKEKTR